MNFTIIIPAYNEALYISRTLESLIRQKHPPHQIIIVDDNSSDTTVAIVKSYVKKYDFIELVVGKPKKQEHQPGSKVIENFQRGLYLVSPDTDILCKYDADLVFPNNYLKVLNSYFLKNPDTGIAGGVCYIEKNNKWTLEKLTNPDHVRGALKAYRKDCFNKIEGLRPAMGWDTLDELLALYYKWDIKVFPELQVKHLKPTGSRYNRKANIRQGIAFYQLGYGISLSVIASLKLAWLKKNPLIFLDYLIGYINASNSRLSYFVNHDEAKFIRKHRWENIKRKIFCR